MAKSGQAEFSKYLGPVLDALRELGGSGHPKEVTDKVAKNLNISDKIQRRNSKKWCVKMGQSSCMGKTIFSLCRFN
jgi:hypothetical protein